MINNRKIRIVVLAAALSGLMALTGCARYVDDLVHRNDPVSESVSDNNSETSKPVETEPLTGPITTADALDDIRVLGQLAMPGNFRITISDDDEKMGATNITMTMNLSESASVATFEDFTAKYGDIAVNIPDFELYMGNSALYLSENAMCTSLVLSPQIELLIAAMDEKGDMGALKAKNEELADALAHILDEACGDGYIKLTSEEASIVPVILATPVSSGMVSGFFGKDLSFVADLFEDSKSDFCSEKDGRHIFRVDNANIAKFYDALLGLEDGQILGLVMMDSYDDPLWSSIGDSTWAYYSSAVQARIDAYRAHWEELKEAAADGKLDYKYELSFDIDSDTDIHIRLEMDSMADGSRTSRVIEIDTVEAPESINIPSGDKILTPEQWEAKTKPVSDKYLDGLIEKEDTDSSSSSSGSD